jgi:multidrug transporter EmrE-like cation transporter
MIGYFFVAMTVVLTVFGQLVLKWQVSLVGPLPEGIPGKALFLAHIMIRPWVLVGLGSAFGAALFWMLALKKMPLSTAYPFTAAGFVLILGFSVVLFGESLTLPKIAGTLLIVAGIVVLAYNT